MKLPVEFFRDENVVTIAKSLIGMWLMTKIDGITTGGIITETEAYNGVYDKASHAYGGRRTKRTETLFKAGGITYVYLCYGIHYMLNVVTSKTEIPDAVLIRGIFPITGIEFIHQRTKKTKDEYKLTNGPGKVTKALGISLKSNGISLGGNTIWIEDHGIKVLDENITIGPRIGVDYAGDDAYLPYRFLLDYNSIKKTPYK